MEDERITAYRQNMLQLANDLFVKEESLHQSTDIHYYEMMATIRFLKLNAENFEASTENVDKISEALQLINDTKVKHIAELQRIYLEYIKKIERIVENAEHI
jgi:hypothetical protein